MTTSFSKLLSDSLIALGDVDASTWSRTDVIWPWCIEAMLQFPILRPRQSAFTMIADSHLISLPSDFREIINVEYPVDQEPPDYLSRKNRFDPDFYGLEIYYDIDRDYASEQGQVLVCSRLMKSGNEININYLANHETDLADSTESLITVPDEYVNILVAYVVAKGYRERLGVYMQDPTAHMTIITQMTNMVDKAEKNYRDLINMAMAKYTDSQVTPHFAADKFDRVY